MNTNTVRTWIERRHFGRAVDLHFRTDVSRGAYKGDLVAFAKPVEWEPLTLELDDLPQPPALTMTADSAQELMDALWRVGFRPSEGTGSAGSLAATEQHLKDMRAIAFDLLAMEQR